MVAARGRNDPYDVRLSALQAIQIDEAATNLECPGGRVVLVFHPDRAAGTARELGPRILRCGQEHRVDQLRGPFQLLQLERNDTHDLPGRAPGNFIWIEPRRSRN